MEKPLTSSPIDETDHGPNHWYDSAERDRDDGPHEIIIEMGDAPNCEENAREAPHFRGRGRESMRLKSFPSSTWSTRSSFSIKKRSRFRIREWMQKLSAFVLQTDVRQGHAEFIPNYRWLPILSGVTIPFATLLQIPGLTERWYVRTNDNQTIDSRPNPPILVAANALAMVAALIANICLILRFLERRVKPMTIISLCLLSIHDIINIVAVTIFGVEHRFSDGFTYGQPFWMTVASTVTSLFTTITLIWDLWKTPDFSKSGSGLTRKQRSLVVIEMILLSWMAFGGLVYSILIGLTFIDGLYFTLVSIETIGFGDLKPNSTGCRIFAIFYNTIGILNIALAVSTARETIIESFEYSYRRRAQELSKRRSEYKRFKATERAKRIEIERKMRETGPPAYAPDGIQAKKTTKEGVATSQPEQFSQTWKERSFRTTTDGTDTEAEGRPGETKFSRTLSVALDLEKNPPRTAYEENYKNFRQEILREERRETAAKLAVALTIFLTFWLTGAAIFTATEKWPYGTSLYFCFVAFSTIGYGDFSPATPAGRSVFVVWALMGVGAMTILFSILSEVFSSRYKNVLSKGPFEHAVKNIRERRASSPPPHMPRSRIRGRSLSVDSSSDQRYTRDHAKRDLEALPKELLNHAKTFHEHIYYLLGSFNGNDQPPQALRKLLEEMAESEHIDARLKREMMEDEGARKTLFMMSYEGTLRKMIDTAERAVALLAKRDLTGSDTLGSTNGKSTPVHDSDAHGSGSSESDPRLRFNFDDQRYRRRSAHMHPQGLASEPDLHLPASSSE